MPACPGTAATASPRRCARAQNWTATFLRNSRMFCPKGIDGYDLSAAGRVREMSEKVDITLTINGRDHAIRVEPRKTLVDAIREDCGQTGTHIGCVTAKRWLGQGWRTRGWGSQSAASCLIRAQVSAPFWLRRPSDRCQPLVISARKATSALKFVGTAW